MGRGDDDAATGEVVAHHPGEQMLPGGKVGSPSTHPYYEVCTNPKLHDLVAALIRTQTADPVLPRA